MEFNEGDPVYYFLGASTVRGTIHQVRKVTVRIMTLSGQIVTKRKEQVRILPTIED